MTVFTWKIAQLERHSADGFVTQVHYRVTAVDELKSAERYGVVEYSQTTEETFVPFEQLTEAQVIGWVQGAVDQQAIETALQAEIDAQQNPTQLTGVPWATNQIEEAA